MFYRCVNFDPVKIEVVKRIHEVEASSSHAVPSFLTELFKLGDVSSFKQPLSPLDQNGVPDGRRINDNGLFHEVFDESGAPKRPLFKPLTEFTQTVLHVEKLAGYYQETSHYQLTGMTEVRRTKARGPGFHPDGNHITRVYLVSDDVAPTIFIYGGRTIIASPFTAMFYTGNVQHSAGPVRKKFRDKPYLLRNMGRLIVTGGFRPR